MTKTRYVIFKIAPNCDRDWGTRYLPGSDRPSLTGILAEHYDFTGGNAPTIGYRISETKCDPKTASLDHHGSTTHYRPSPWKVVSAQEYVPNIPDLQDYSEIVICYCDYDPLPDEDNPWVEYGRAIVSPDSFGEDRAAFDQFVAGLTEDDRQRYQIVDPD